MLNFDIDGCVLKATASRESSHWHLDVYCWNAAAGDGNFNFQCSVVSSDLSLFRKLYQMAVQQTETFLRRTGSTRKVHPTPKHVQYHCCMTESKQHSLQLITFEDCPFMNSHLPDAKSKDVRDEKGGNEDFEEFSREDATILHYSTLPHTKRNWTSGMLKVKLSEKNNQQAVSRWVIIIF